MSVGAAGAPETAPRLLELQLDALLAQLGSGETAWGSGAAGAVVAAMAAEVVAAAAIRSADEWEHALGAAAQAHSLRLRLAPLAAADAEAYRAALELLDRRAPDDRGSEQRDFRLGRALARAADIPLTIAEGAADVAQLALEVAERTSVAPARADAASAAAVAHGAARAAAHLVRINLATTPTDARVRAADALAAESGAAAEAALALQ